MRRKWGLLVACCVSIVSSERGGFFFLPCTLLLWCKKHEADRMFKVFMIKEAALCQSDWLREGGSESEGYPRQTRTPPLISLSLSLLSPSLLYSFLSTSHLPLSFSLSLYPPPSSRSVPHSYLCLVFFSTTLPFSLFISLHHSLILFSTYPPHPTLWSTPPFHFPQCPMRQWARICYSQ